MLCWEAWEPVSKVSPSEILASCLLRSDPLAQPLVCHFLPNTLSTSSLAGHPVPLSPVRVLCSCSANCMCSVPLPCCALPSTVSLSPQQPVVCLAAPPSFAQHQLSQVLLECRMPYTLPVSPAHPCTGRALPPDLGILFAWHSTAAAGQ